MNWGIGNIFCDIEVIKEKLDDLATTHCWFVNDAFTTNNLKTIEEVKHYGLGYREHRIHNNQIVDLMLMYLKELDGKIKQFNVLLEQEKSALSHADQSEDNTHK